MRVLVTGANGFVGQAAAQALAQAKFEVVPAVRESIGSGQVAVGHLDGSTDWRAALAGCDVVLHLAARVHVMREEEKDPLSAYRSVNTDGTLNLARQAAQAGVRRLLFISSIKVNGEQTMVGSAFRATDTPQPRDDYAISKYEAEVGLRRIAADTGMEVVVIRPPLIYGPGVNGNFASMVRWLKRGLPLPFGAVTHNRRSLVALDNMVDLITTCIDHPAAANQTFLISDGEDVSTTELLRRIGRAMGKSARLWPIPCAFLQASVGLLGKRDIAKRLLGNLQVDVSHTCQRLGWKPVISLDEGLRRTVQTSN